MGSIKFSDYLLNVEIYEFHCTLLTYIAFDMIAAKIILTVVNFLFFQIEYIYCTFIIKLYA